MELELRVPFTKFLARALGLLGVALFGWFLPGRFRYLLWLSIAGILRLGFLEELRPVVFGLWPRFGVRFRDGALWWLPLGPNWYLLWDALREGRPGLADWRRTPLAAYFLVQAKQKKVRPEVPGELYPIAEELELPLGLRGLAFLLGFSSAILAQLILPQGQGALWNLPLGTFTGFIAETLDQTFRLRAYARALSAYWAEEEGR